MREPPLENVRPKRVRSGHFVKSSYDLTFFRRAYVRLHRVIRDRWAFRLYLVHRRPILRPAPTAERPLGDYEFVEPEQEQVLRSAENPALNISADFVRGAFRRKDRCFAASNRGELVGYYWISSSGSVPLTDDLSFVFEPSGGVYCPLVLVHPRCRGRRLYQRLVAYGDQALLESGHAHLIGCVESHNFPSRKALSRIPGIRLVGIVGAFRLFGRLVTFRSWGAMRHGYAIRRNRSRQPAAQACPAPTKPAFEAAQADPVGAKERAADQAHRNEP